MASSWLSLGIRLALGGQPRDLRRLVLREGLHLVTAGVALGIPAALGLGRVVRGLLFGVHPADGVTFAGAVTTLLERHPDRELRAGTARHTRRSDDCAAD